MVTEKMQGGTFGGVDDLYREVILEHFKSPRNKGPLPEADLKADGMNPLCGDKISLSARVKDGKVAEVHFDGHGCAISQSSASMMTAVFKGRPVEETKELTRLFKSIFGIESGNGEAPVKFTHDDLGDLQALEGVKRYPVRIKCALLAWNTWLEALKTQG
jgi:nitrogen fixation protein NifU and related proteins